MRLFRCRQPERKLSLPISAAQPPKSGPARQHAGIRSVPFILNLLANPSDASADDVHVWGCEDYFHKLRPSMKAGVCVNFMSGDEQDRVP